MITLHEMILRIFLGALIGGIIGFERESHGRPAGFRTQLLVCVAAVLIMIISENYYHYLPSESPSLRIDPARIASSALIGIGFLGAGVIIKSGLTIRGLTTAASIWIVSVIGLAIGGGFYLAAVITTFITIVALVLLRSLERKINILLYKTVTVSARTAADVEDRIVSLLSEYDMQINSIDYENNVVDNELVYHFNVSTRNKKAIKDLFIRLGALEFVQTVKIDSRDKLLV
jgi:putative Mg2+ transporter-C (MgtC) family protein